MKWDYDYQGLPEDLQKRLTRACTTAEIAFREAKKAARTRSDDRWLLIDLRIRPEVIAYAGCMCEMARRGLVSVGRVEGYVDGYLRSLARTLCPDPHINSASYEPFVQEAVHRVTQSSEWDAHMAELLSVTELPTADSASKEVERRVETPATPGAGTVVESQTEQPVAPVLTPDPATAPTGDMPTVPDAAASGSDTAAVDALPEFAVHTTDPLVADRLLTKEGRLVAVKEKLARITKEQDVFPPLSHDTDFWHASPYLDRGAFEDWIEGKGAESADQAFRAVLEMDSPSFLRKREQWPARRAAAAERKKKHDG